MQYTERFDFSNVFINSNYSQARAEMYSNVLYLFTGKAKNVLQCIVFIHRQGQKCIIMYCIYSQARPEMYYDVLYLFTGKARNVL